MTSPRAPTGDGASEGPVGAYVTHVNLAPGFRGGERQTQLLVEGLARDGWRQRLVARRGGPLIERCADVAGLDVAPARGPLAAARALAGAALVHVHQGRAIQAAWIHRFLGGAPYVVTRRIQKGPGRTWLNRVMYRKAAARVAVSAAIADAMRTFDAGSSCEVIPDATSGLVANPEAVAAIRARSVRGPGGLLVGNASALVDSHKGQRQILEVARRLRDTEANVTFLLMGSGRDEASLKAAAADLPNVLFTGFVENVGDHLAALDVFFYPSRHEGLGSILLDAMAFGLPVLATRVGGIPEIIEDPLNGTLCAVDDIEGQTAALLALIRDPARRDTVAAANRAKAGDYSVERMTRRYVDLYRRVLR